MMIFEIHSTPVPQKQTVLGKGRFYDPSKKDRESIIWQLRPHAPKEPLTGALSVDITFYLPIPKATSNLTKKQMINNVHFHVKRPDIDNLSYIVVNAMNNLIYTDDSQIVELTLHKRFSEQPKTIVKVMEL